MERRIKAEEKFNAVVKKLTPCEAFVLFHMLLGHDLSQMLEHLRADKVVFSLFDDLAADLKETYGVVLEKSQYAGWYTFYNRGKNDKRLLQLLEQALRRAVKKTVRYLF